MRTFGGAFHGGRMVPRFPVVPRRDRTPRNEDIAASLLGIDRARVGERGDHDDVTALRRLTKGLPEGVEEHPRFSDDEGAHLAGAHLEPSRPESRQQILDRSRQNGLSQGIETHLRDDSLHLVSILRA